MHKKLIAMAVAASLLPLTGALAQETRIAPQPLVKDGLIISAAYLGPEHLDMAPMLPGMHQAADIHLETDVFADKDNPQGLQPGTWIPYLTITYMMKKEGGQWSTAGRYMPMIASDGMHYGNNVKLDGPGRYTLALHIEPPPYAGFFRHTDKEIGVAPWWEPFDVSWSFDWKGNAARKMH